MSLNSISPIDGRYEKYTKDLVPYFSEAAVMKYRMKIEVEYLIVIFNNYISYVLHWLLILS